MLLTFKGCDNWAFQQPAYLGGIALDSDGNKVFVNTPFDTLHGAQVACTKLGDGCGGLTGRVTNGVRTYDLRHGTSFISSPSAEFSYLKPVKQCPHEGKF